MKSSHQNQNHNISTTMVNNSMIFKIFDQAIEHYFEIYVVIIKNKRDDETSAKLLEPWEMRIHFNIPSMSDLGDVDISTIVYREIKKSDIYNICNINTTYDYNNDYAQDAITFIEEPIQFRKYFVNQGFRQRLNLNVDLPQQEQMDEYSLAFKDVKYLDIFVEQLKSLLKDSAQAGVSKEMFI